MAEEEKVEDTPPPARASKLVVLLQILNLLGTGGVGALVFLSPGAQAPVDENVKAEEEPERVVTALDPFVVNLNEEESSRYLKTTLEFEMADNKAAERLDSKVRLIRDDLLGYFSGLKVEDTLGEANKDEIRSEIMRRAAAYFAAGQLKQVYFTEFVVQ